MKHAQARVEKDDAVTRNGDVESETADVNLACGGIELVWLTANPLIRLFY
jgi:hypothetical protein